MLAKVLLIFFTSILFAANSNAQISPRKDSNPEAGNPRLNSPDRKTVAESEKDINKCLEELKTIPRPDRKLQILDEIGKTYQDLLEDKRDEGRMRLLKAKTESVVSLYISNINDSDKTVKAKAIGWLGNFATYSNFNSYITPANGKKIAQLLKQAEGDDDAKVRTLAVVYYLQYSKYE